MNIHSHTHTHACTHLGTMWWQRIEDIDTPAVRTIRAAHMCHTPLWFRIDPPQLDRFCPVTASVGVNPYCLRSTGNKSRVWHLCPVHPGVHSHPPAAHTPLYEQSNEEVHGRITSPESDTTAPLADTPERGSHTGSRCPKQAPAGTAPCGPLPPPGPSSPPVTAIAYRVNDRHSLSGGAADWLRYPMHRSPHASSDAVATPSSTSHRGSWAAGFASMSPRFEMFQWSSRVGAIVTVDVGELIAVVR